MENKKPFLHSDILSKFNPSVPWTFLQTSIKAPDGLFGVIHLNDVLYKVRVYKHSKKHYNYDIRFNDEWNRFSCYMFKKVFMKGPHSYEAKYYGDIKIYKQDLLVEMYRIYPSMRIKLCIYDRDKFKYDFMNEEEHLYYELIKRTNPSVLDTHIKKSSNTDLDNLKKLIQ